ncbi:DNA-directed DNA polymerase [Lobulomyces angularis]|nr:DNA-directed DNA polymerase [Lobulomyces angularis]
MTSSTVNSAKDKLPETTMQFYWELADLDEKVRIKAAKDLITTIQSLNNNESGISQNNGQNLNEIQQDLSYALKRLCKGIVSGRDGARQGFSLALTELLSAMEWLHSKTVLDLIETSCVTTGGMKGEEERDVLFGRIFGVMAMIRSGILFRKETTLEDLKRVLKLLSDSLVKKSFLAESCCFLILNLIKNINANFEQRDEFVQCCFEAIYFPKKGEKIETINTEQLWFALEMQEKYPNLDWKSVLVNFKNKKIVCSLENVSCVREILKESTVTHPNIHSIWESFIDLIFKRNKTFLKVEDFWMFIIEDSFFNSTHERKYLGFQIFQIILPKLKNSEVPTIFSKNFMRCLINNLSGEKTYLHKVAKKTSQAISSTAKDNKDFSFQFFLQLVGKNGHHNFDKITKTQTVTSILSSISEEGINDFLNHLFSTFTKEDDQLESNVTELKRIWCLEKLSNLLKLNVKLPGKEWKKKAIGFLAVVGFIDLNENVNYDNRLLPKVSKKISEESRLNFFSSLDNLIKQGEKNYDWCFETVSLLFDLLKSKKNFLHKFGSELESKLMEIFKNLTELENNILKVETVENSMLDKELTLEKKKKTSLKALISLMLLKILEDPKSDFLELCLELSLILDRLFLSAKNEVEKKKKKRKSLESAEETEELGEGDVLVDIFITLLSKPSILIRNLAIYGFNCFSESISEKGLDVIFNVLEPQTGRDSDILEIEDDGEDVSESESEEESEEIEDASEEEEENESFKVLVPPGDENVDSDDGLDDDEMGAFDHKLVEIFKEKKRLLAEKKASKQILLHFKLKVIDLLENFSKKQSHNQLMVYFIPKLLSLTLRTYVKNTLNIKSEQLQVHQKLENFTKKLIKVKEVPKGLKKELVLNGLEECFDLMKKYGQSKPLINIGSNCCLLFVRIFGQCSDETVEKSHKKQKLGKESKKVEKEFSLTSIYTEAFKNLQKKNTKLTKNIFLDLKNRYRKISVNLLFNFSELIKVQAIENNSLFKFCEGIEIFSEILHSIPKKEIPDEKEYLTKCLKCLSLNFLDSLKFISEELKKENVSHCEDQDPDSLGEDEEGVASVTKFKFNQKRLKESLSKFKQILKFYLKFLSKEELNKIIDGDCLREHLTKFKDLNGLENAIKELSKLI